VLRQVTEESQLFIQGTKQDGESTQWFIRNPEAMCTEQHSQGWTVSVPEGKQSTLFEERDQCPRVQDVEDVLWPPVMNVA